MTGTGLLAAPATAWALAGSLVAVGVLLLVRGVRPGPVDLATALAELGPPRPGSADEHERARTGSERVGLAVASRWPGATGAAARARLRLAGTSVGEHWADKLVGALLGALVPPVATVALVGIDASLALPALAALLGAALGFVVPDLRLEGRAERRRVDASAAVVCLFDLTVLERLANQSGPQALARAAAVSRHPVFVELAAALDRARLEQVAPWAQLRALAVEWRLHALGDLADVMALEDHGASLADGLRARVAELRDAHLLGIRRAAHRTSERMGAAMVVPSLVLALALLLPPLLTLAGAP